MADVDDRWFRTVKLPDGTKSRERTSRHGVGKRWVARWRDDRDKQRKRSFERKVDAEGFISGIRADMARGTYIDPNAGKVTLQAYGEQWLKAQTFEATTREAVENRLRMHIFPHLGGKELRVLASRPSLVQAWARGLQADLAPTYVRVIFSNLSGVLSAAVDDGLIAKNPCSVRSVKPPTVDRKRVIPWTREQTHGVLDALPERYRRTGVVAAGCGLRQGEVFGLAVDDVDFLGRMVHVRRQVRIVGSRLVFAPPKGGKERDVPLPGSVGLELAAHIKAFPPVEVTLPWREPGGQPVTARLLFTSRDSCALNRHYFNSHVWKPALTAAGLESSRAGGMHALRHYYASVLLDAGESIKAVSSYLGHSDAGFTLRTYTHLMPASEERTRKAVDRALSGPTESSCAPDVTRGGV